MDTAVDTLSIWGAPKKGCSPRASMPSGAVNEHMLGHVPQAEFLHLTHSNLDKLSMFVNHCNSQFDMSENTKYRVASDAVDSTCRHVYTRIEIYGQI